MAGDPASGFFWSILFMIASVLTLGFAVVFSIARVVRRAESRSIEADAMAAEQLGA